MDEENKELAKEELYLLITKFLQNGPCSRTLQTLKAELAENQLVPKRLDWEGQYHDQTIEDWLKKNRHIHNEFLLDACLRTATLVSKEYPASTLGIKSILGTGSQSLLRTSKDGGRKFWRVSDYSVPRKCSLLYSSKPSLTHNLALVLHGRELSGPIRKTDILTPQIFSRTKLFRTALGHLSAVYCVLFDKSGNYIITGADDFLVKVWSANSGRLLCSLRGSSSEISDIAINLKNTLIAAGCVDKQIRVWCLQTSYPVAILSAHSGMITGVFFCPLNISDSFYLISTSSDGSVAFWNYSEEPGGLYNFPSQPVLYNEKMRPGQAQIICGSFSAGGMFLATGSADHHVRVYSMEFSPPQRIMEMAKHSERVDSIQWANHSLRFVSGSKDGSAIIWEYRAQQWHTLVLSMATSLPDVKAVESSVKLRVTMVCWSCDDSRVMTAVNNYSLKVWDSRSGKLLYILNSHKDEIYVVENHPLNPAVMFTAGHDGLAFLWDIVNGKQLAMFKNQIEGQGNGSVFDAKWSPDGTMVAATDSHGHLLIFGLNDPSELMSKLPKEMFFHTDYRPLVRTGDGHLLDVQGQLPPHLMPPPYLVDVDGNLYPPSIQKLVPGRELCTCEHSYPNISFRIGGLQDHFEGLSEDSDNNVSMRINEQTPNSDTSRSGGNRPSEEGWNYQWARKLIVPALKPSEVRAAEMRIASLSAVELTEYHREQNRAPVIVASAVPQQQPKKKRTHGYRTRATWDQEDDTASSSSGHSRGNETSDATAATDNLSGTSSSSDHESSEYSDWVADQGGVSLAPPQRSRRRRKKVPLTAVASASQTRSSESSSAPAASTSRRSRSNALRTATTRSLTSENTVSPQTLKTEPLPSTSKQADIPELYRPSEWLSEVIPKKFPYYPQMGDEVMFFKKGYQLYMNAVKEKGVYPLAKTQLAPWGKLNLKEPELVKVIGIKYEIRPPRLCCLRLAVMKLNGKLTGERFTIKYHDIPDVLDFLVLRHTYDIAIDRNWKNGDRFRSMIDDSWWWGVIVATRRKLVSGTDVDSHFLCHRIKWDNGEEEDMSPWDMEPPDFEREPEDDGSGIPVLPREIEATLYRPRDDEWPCGDRDLACNRILDGLHKIMGLAVAEPFNAPVDTNLYPSYATVVEYPADLSLIKARLENRFYRRLTAVQFDVRYLATNAEKFNEPHSAIVKQARIVTDLCLQLMKEDCVIDVTASYRQLVDAYQSSLSETDNEEVCEDEARVSKSISQRAAANRYLRAMRRADRNQQSPDWKKDCRHLLEILFNSKDSEPFRGPVDSLKYPDYEKIISTPIDLSTIREELKGGNYDSPLDFCKDIRTIFNNSKIFNTNKRSKAYEMTARLSELAEEEMKKVVQNWRRSSKTSNNLQPVKRSDRKRKVRYAIDSSPPDYDSDDDYSTKLSKAKGKRPINKRNDGGRRKRSQRKLSSFSEEDKHVSSESSEGNSENEWRGRVNNKSGLGKSGTSSESEQSESVVTVKGSGHRLISDDFLAVPGPSKNWSLNKNGVRILPPVRKPVVCPEEVLNVGQEVVLGENENSNNSERATRSSTLSNKTISRSSNNEDSNCDKGSAGETEDEDDDLVEVGGNYEESDGISSQEDYRKRVTIVEAPSDDSESDEEENAVLSNSVKRSELKRSRVCSSEESGSSINNQRGGRPKRTIKRKTYFDESDDESTQNNKRSSLRQTRVVRNSHRPQRHSSNVKHYRESSDSEKEQPLSISLHGRVRKLRPQVRAFLKDS